MKANLFTPFTLRGVTFKNRIFLSPMDQYCSRDGISNAWHLAHYGSRAMGGAACLIQEATAISPEGRITPGDLGIWSDEHVEAFRPLVDFIKEQGCVPGIQLAHAGRKGSTFVPWEGSGALSAENGGWDVVAPSALPFDATSPMPRALSVQDIESAVLAFAEAARRAVSAGYEVVELHAAHGYLMHQFLSPISNQRTDKYGGSLENRMRFVLDVARAVRSALPGRVPLLVRISATDWVARDGWDLPQSVALCKELKSIGVDLIDVSTGGLITGVKIVTGPGYQVPFAESIKKEAEIPVGAVGRIVEASQAEQIVANRNADVVFIGRELLRDPFWPLHAARTLGEDVRWPGPYERAKLPVA
ncbi:MAG: NADH:flavin oxidoreductase/NADH oxidase [Alphaproteobacteria bacterium]|nr:NADH:flavin oxidoreductase/NADH oxidase [Alphaproteobacteria bacterium]